MAGKLKILGFAGSLRKESYNKALLRAAAGLVPDGAELEAFDLAGIPLFNQDLENEPAQRVREFKAAIRAADALLIVTPEYNHSIPGVLKNALDNVSRPPGDNACGGKPAAILGASTGMMGSSRSQYHLRQVCAALNMHVLNLPEVFVSFVEGKVDGDGRITDEKTRDQVRRILEALVQWTRRLRGEG